MSQTTTNKKQLKGLSDETYSHLLTEYVLRAVNQSNIGEISDRTARYAESIRDMEELKEVVGFIARESSFSMKCIPEIKEIVKAYIGSHHEDRIIAAVYYGDFTKAIKLSCRRAQKKVA